MFLLNCFRKKQKAEVNSPDQAELPPPKKRKSRHASSLNPTEMKAGQLPAGFRPGVPWHTPIILETLMFGRFPFQEEVQELQSYGITHFLNLTQENEEYKGMKLEPYLADHQVSCPIVERDIPHDDDAFLKCMSSLRDIILNGGKVYIHCKHGRGRSAMVATILLAVTRNLSYNQAILEINEGHWYGHGQSSHFRNKVIPPHTNQRQFAESFLDRWYESADTKVSCEKNEPKE